MPFACSSALPSPAVAPVPSVSVADSASAGRDPAEAAIHFYQRYLSALRHGRCRFQPSCSQYAAEAIRAYGVVEGTARAADRLVRCNQASGRYFARSADGRLIDPVSGTPSGPRLPLVPAWALPDPGGVPATATTASASADSRSGRIAEILSFAASLAQSGDCSGAATEYRRGAHLAGDAELEAWSHERSANCYFDAAEWLKAEPEFLSAAMVATRSQDSRRASLMAGACRFNAGDYAACASILEDCEKAGALTDAAPADGPASDAFEAPVPIGAADRARNAGLLGLCSLARGDWPGARERFRAGLDADVPGPYARRLALLSTWTDQGPRLPHKNRTLATALSIGLPGAGQVYAGRTPEGLRHLFFNGALIYSIVRLARGGHYPAALALTGFEVPFYLGNVIGAKHAAAWFNRERRMELVARAIAQSGR